MRILFSICILSCYFAGIAQDDRVYHKQFTEEDGLALETIKALALDDNGFLWLGGGINRSRSELFGNATPVSLQRFNGHSFHSITLSRSDISRVADIFKREDGQFYIVTEIALYHFNPITSEVSPIHVSEDRGISNVVAYQGKYYILTQNDREVILYTIHPDLYLEEQFRFTASVSKIAIDSKTQFIPFEDKIIFSDDNFPITCTDWQGNILHTIEPEKFQVGGERRLDKKWIDEYFQMQDEHYVLLYNNPQLYRLLPETIQILPVAGTEEEFVNDNLKTFVDSKGGNIIVTQHQDQVIIKSIQNKDNIQTIYTDSNFESISSFSLLSQDITKDIWFTTAGTLNYVKFPPDVITRLLPNVETRAIASLTEDTHLIASEKDGFYLFNSKEKTTQPYPIFENGIAHKPDSPRNIFVDEGTIWSSDFGVGIIQIDTLTHKSTYYRHYPITNMVRPTDSTIIYGTNAYNLMEFNTRNKTHTPLLVTDSLFIQDLEWRKEDNYIIASTNKGLLSYNIETKNHAFYNSPEQLPDPFLLMGDYHPDYGYLQGSRTGVITSFDPKTEIFKTLYKDELKAAIATLLFDDQDTWWINTFNGYVSYNPETKEKHRFSIKDGFTTNEANRYSALKTKDGFLVGTIDGVNFFEPAALQPEPRDERLIPLRVKTYNTKEKVFLTSYDQQILEDEKTITLPSENRTLEVDFALSQVDITRNERYQYRLDSGDWTPLGSSQSIRFPNLAPGNYDLEIEALDFSGKKIGDSLILPIHSKNFFYKTGWFFLSILLLSTALLMWLLKQQQLRKQLQEQFSEDLMNSQEQERSRIAKDLHDSVGQQLTLIKRRLQEKGDTAISELTNRTLEDVRHISRNLYPAILKQLGLSGSVEQLLYNIDEQTDLFVSAEIDDIDDFFDEKASLHIYRFIQENVSNVMKHAFAKAISVTLQQQEKGILITIKDNGKGFDVLEKQKNNSLGLKTLQERIRILEGTLTIESSAETGTLTTAQIPYSHAKS